MLTRRVRTGPARRGPSLARQRGAGSIEYIGLLLIVSVALALGSNVGSILGQQEGSLVKHIQYGICVGLQKGYEAVGIETDKACQKPEGSDEGKLPPCTTYRQDRLLGVNGTFRFIRGELTGKDTIVDTIDPATGKEKSYVFLSNEGGAGVELNEGGKGNLLNKLDKKGIGVNAKAVLQGGTGVVYEFDSHDDAQSFLDSRRGNIFTRSLGVITGGKAEALFDGARKGIKKLGGLLGIGDGEDDGPTPSGVTAELAVQADATVSYEGGPKNSPINGRADVNALGRAEGEFRYNFDGTSQLQVEYKGEVGLNGGVGANKDLKKKFPLLGDLSVTGGGNLAGGVTYRIQFDKSGKPTNFILITESGGGLQWKAGAKRGHAGGKDGQIIENRYNLDLTDPENLEAFQKTLPALAAGGTASPLAFLATDTPLSDKLQNNSVQYEQVYDTEGDTIAGDAPNSKDEKGIKVKGVGVGFNNETAKRTLRSARYIDHTQPGATWQPLANCTKE